MSSLMTTMTRIPAGIIGLFCKRALKKRLYSDYTMTVQYNDYIDYNTCRAVWNAAAASSNRPSCKRWGGNERERRNEWERVRESSVGVFVCVFVRVCVCFRVYVCVCVCVCVVKYTQCTFSACLQYAYLVYTRCTIHMQCTIVCICSAQCVYTTVCTSIVQCAYTVCVDVTMLHIYPVCTHYSVHKHSRCVYTVCVDGKMLNMYSDM